MMLYILIGYMFLFIHRPFEVWPTLGDFHIERLYMLGAIAAWCVAPGKRLQPTRLDLGIIFFCMAIIFAWMLSPYSDGCEATVEDYFKIVVFYVLVTTAISKPRDLRLLLLAFLGIMTVYMMHSLWEFHNGRLAFRMGIARLIGVDKTLGDPNSFGASIVYSLPFLRLFWISSERWLIKLFLAGYLGLASLCVMLTGSRSSFLGLGLWGFITCMQSRHRITFLVLGVAMAAGSIAALPQELQTRFETIINPDVGPENAKVSGQGRIEGLVNGFKLLQQYPLSGCGPGVWRKATGSEIESHNLYGQLMGELGALGVVTFGSLVVGFVVAIWKFRQRCRRFHDPDGKFLFQLTGALGTAVVLLLLEGFFGHNLFRFSWLWYIGFLIIASRAAKSVQATTWWHHEYMPLAVPSRMATVGDRSTMIPDGAA